LDGSGPYHRPRRGHAVSRAQIRTLRHNCARSIYSGPCPDHCVGAR
jgi:hypothetical protein